MGLNELWFLLVAVLFVGFFVLEGFDFGVGVVSRFLGRDEREKTYYLNTIGPFWDANEVWLITAGGAMFAAFPHWYATLFSGFYIPLVFMLLALILRGVSFEFKGREEGARWQNFWGWTLWIGSLLPPVLWGVVLANFMTGMPINHEKEMVGGFLQFLHPFALLSGLMFLMLCVTHGLQFITLRTTGEQKDRARQLGKKLAPVTIILFLAFIVVGYVVSDVFTYHGQTFMMLPILAWISLLFSNLYNNQKMDINAFILTCATFVLLIGSIFIGMFPRVMISSISDAYSLTIMSAASGAYTLKVMTFFALGLLPFVLGYTAWSYYIFRKRLKIEDETEY